MGILYSATSEVSMEESKVSREASMPSGASDEVSVGKGEAIPPLGGEDAGNNKGLRKT